MCKKKKKKKKKKKGTSITSTGKSKRSMTVEEQAREEFHNVLRAVHAQNIPLLKELIRTGSNPDAVEDSAHPSGVPALRHGATALWLASTKGNYEMMEILLAAGASTELLRSDTGASMLILAVNSTDLLCAEKLLQHGAKPNTINDQGFTALITAALSGNGRMISLLADAPGIDINRHGVRLPREGERWPGVQRQLACNQSMCLSGITALHAAVGSGSYRTYLDADGRPVILGDVLTVKALLDAGAEVDALDDLGNTPAKLAVLFQRLEVLTLLLEHGASTFRAVQVPKSMLSNTMNAAEKLRSTHIENALAASPGAIHVLADYGGFRVEQHDCPEGADKDDALQTRRLFQRMPIGAPRSTYVALAQVGCDVWCDGGCNISLQSRGNAAGKRTLFLGEEIVGHMVQIRIRAEHLALESAAASSALAAARAAPPFLPKPISKMDHIPTHEESMAAFARNPFRAAPPRLFTGSPMALIRGDHIVLYGLTSSSGLPLNGKRGKIGGPLGAVVAGRYPVLFKGAKGYKQIKPSNLRSLASRARKREIAGHEIDFVQSITVSGFAGSNSDLNGPYGRSNQVFDRRFGFPIFVFNSENHGSVCLHSSKNGTWFISGLEDCIAEQAQDGQCRGIATTAFQQTTPVGALWKEAVERSPSFEVSEAIKMEVSAYLNFFDMVEEIAGSAEEEGRSMQSCADGINQTFLSEGLLGTPPSPWEYRDAVVESYNPHSQEHKLVFCDSEKTTRHFPLEHFRFIDYDVQPRRRAAILNPRMVKTILLTMDRIALELQLRKEEALQDGIVVEALVLPTGTPVLRVFAYVMMSSIRDFAAIFQDYVWPFFLGPFFFRDWVVEKIAAALTTAAAQAVAAAQAAERVAADAEAAVAASFGGSQRAQAGGGGGGLRQRQASAGGAAASTRTATSTAKSEEI